MSDFSDTWILEAFGKANKVLGNKMVSLVLFSPYLEKFTLNLLHSIHMLCRDTKKA